MTRYARHTVTARVSKGDESITLGVKSATVTLDDSWAPFIQGTLVCSLPADPAMFDIIDPKQDARLSLVLDERVGEGGVLADFDTDWGAGTLGTLFSSGTLGDITAEHFHSWSSDDVTGSRRHFDVGLRSRRIDHRSQELTLTFASDEALLQDYALMSTVSETPGSTSVKTAALYALSKISATLDAASSDANVDDAAALVWFPGTSAWEYLEPLVQTTGLRLWCDESRVWRLTPRDVPVGDGTVMNEFTEAADTVSRDDGAWADGVVVEYLWTDDADVRRTKRDIAGGTGASKVLRIPYATPYPGRGAAKLMLDRMDRRGRVLDLTGLAHYTAYPNSPFTASPPNTPVQTGVVERVTFDLPAGLMTLTSRGLVDTDPTAWLLIPAGESWLSNPVGGSWLNETIGA